ncbi:Hypothetical protein CAP_5317 [Chondromyces apiculatus DSM 436]|uniref:Uncharacterized protein n=1 Tax=Chondromyces apiculatus DSM 436 TaxID=1192034 RepID=A0A017T572_9BACT|nr:Hypothetical protein CAP_5317 [Chondromyces apiculatus DSM 436]
MRDSVLPGSVRDHDLLALQGGRRGRDNDICCGFPGRRVDNAAGDDSSALRQNRDSRK